MSGKARMKGKPCCHVWKHNGTFWKMWMPSWRTWPLLATAGQAEPQTSPANREFGDSGRGPCWFCYETSQEGPLCMHRDI